MSFRWTDYLGVAKNLAGYAQHWTDVTEACQRSAISRAYYAAFCEARGRLIRCEGKNVPNSGESHRIVPEHFEQSGDKRKKTVGQNLRRLLVSRCKADYDDTMAGLQKESVWAVNVAEFVLKQLTEVYDGDADGG